MRGTNNDDRPLLPHMNSVVENDTQALQAALDTAEAMMAITDVSSLVISRVHCFGVAQRVYERALTLVPRVVVTMDAQEEARLWARLCPIRDWLERTGRQLDRPEAV
jgi:hypothetical protein